MKTKSNLGSQQTKLSLQRIVSKLLANFQPVAVRQKSFIVNDIPGELWVNTDESLLSSLIGSLFSAVINRSKCACIRVSAITHNNCVMLDVRDSNSNTVGRLPKELEDAQPIAEELGGCITMNHMQKNIMTVGLSFLSPKIAA